MAVFAHSITIFLWVACTRKWNKAAKKVEAKESQFDGQNRNVQDYIHTYFHPYYYIVVIEKKQVEEQKNRRGWRRLYKNFINLSAT